MQNMASKKKNNPPVICLGGPTGSGKTWLSLRLAEHFNGEIINADSRQIYRDFPVISAQPLEADTKRIIHHLFGITEITQKISAMDWAMQVAKILYEIQTRNHAAIIIGGTGFYFQALLNGLSAIPQATKEAAIKAEKEIALHGARKMYDTLANIDPEFAAKIHFNDKQRIQRGLEIFYSTKKPLSYWHHASVPNPVINASLYFLNPALCYLENILKQRIDEMLANGAIEETRNVMQKCDNINMPGWSAIGARDLYYYIKGCITLEECKKNWLKKTRAYAKRQLTWFRHKALPLDFDDPESNSQLNLERMLNEILAKIISIFS